jgi:thioredoxin reductase
VLLATGVVDEQPPIEGIVELWGRGVYHCPYCHGYEVRGTPLAVLGGSPAAVHLALHLRHLSDDVVLCTHGNNLDPATAALLAANGVPMREEEVVRLEARDGTLERVVLARGDALPRHAVFSTLAPMRQRSELPRQLGCRMLEDDAVEIDQLGRTSVPGVFAAGDMARRGDSGRMSAVIMAAASGTIAGAAITRDLVSEDAELARMAATGTRSAWLG